MLARGISGRRQGRVHSNAQLFAMLSAEKIAGINQKRGRWLKAAAWR
jgi:hypothetical protein